MVGAVLFALLTMQHPAVAHSFASLVKQGPRVLAELPAAHQLLVQREIADAFRGAFPTIASFTTGGLLMARWLPVRRI